MNNHRAAHKYIITDFNMTADGNIIGEYGSEI
jgi:hypothetical protein